MSTNNSLFAPLEKEKKQQLIDLENTYFLSSYWKDVWLILKKRRSALWGLYLLGMITFLSLICPFITPHTYYDTDLKLQNLPPSSVYWFGTDELGRDLFARCWWGARISLFVGFTAAFINLVIGVTYGSFAGFKEGKVDEFMMRVCDILHSIPYFLIVILLIVVMGAGITTIIIALTMTGWINMARIVRSQILQIKQQEFVKAAYALGASNRRILWKHLIPNTIGPILVTLTFMIPMAIFTESFLSFLGLGIQAPIASWGTIANDGLAALRYYPWRLFIPAILICITMLSINLIGDGLREAMDPRLRK